MTYLLFALLYLAQLARGASTDDCPHLSGTTRSVWGILGGCALTLLVCAWQTLHFPVPQNKWQAAVAFKCLCFLGFLFAPEVMIAYASREWWIAYEEVVKFRGKGYQWSMTHSFFGGMGGFAYCDENGTLNTIDCDRFLELCEQNKIANPHLTAKEIKDRSKSDLPGKAILTVQIVWFVLQDIVRGPRDLAVTLVELDTICMIVISLIAMFLWWHKPLRPEYPHVFYSIQAEKQEKSGQDIIKSSDMSSKHISAENKQALSDAWKPDAIVPIRLTAFVTPARKSSDKETGTKPTKEISAPPERRRLVDKIDKDFLTMIALCLAWIILGGLHLIAWDFEFPTEAERITWRVVSLVLVACPLPFLGSILMIDSVPWPPARWRNDVSAVVMILAAIVGFCSRAILVGLTLASLRALPCSAHQVISWTKYIPHL